MEERVARQQAFRNKTWSFVFCSSHATSLWLFRICCFIFLRYKATQLLHDPESSLPFPIASGSSSCWYHGLEVPVFVLGVLAGLLWLFQWCFSRSRKPALGCVCAGGTDVWEHWGFTGIPALLPKSWGLLFQLSLLAGVRASPSLPVCWESLTQSQDFTCFYRHPSYCFGELKAVTAGKH